MLCNFISALAENVLPTPLETKIQIPSSHHSGGTILVPILHTHTQIPAFYNSSSGNHLCQLFKILTSFDKYSRQGHGAGGRPVGNLTTIHTNITTINFRLLLMEHSASTMGYVQSPIFYIPAEVNVSSSLCKGINCSTFRNNIIMVLLLSSGFKDIYELYCHC